MLEGEIIHHAAIDNKLLAWQSRNFVKGIDLKNHASDAGALSDLDITTVGDTKNRNCGWGRRWSSLPDYSNCDPWVEKPGGVALP